MGVKVPIIGESYLKFYVRVGSQDPGKGSLARNNTRVSALWAGRRPAGPGHQALARAQGGLAGQAEQNGHRDYENPYGFAHYLD